MEFAARLFALIRRDLPFMEYAGEFCGLAAVTEVQDVALLHLFRLGACYHRPIDLPDTTGLCWREGVYRCLGSVRARVGTSPSTVALPCPPLPAENMASPLIIDLCKCSPVPAPRQRPPVPAPRQRPPVTAPRQRPPVPASPGPVPPMPASPGPVPHEFALPERPQEFALQELPQVTALPERPQESAPRKCPPVPAPRKCPPVGTPEPAPRQRTPEPAPRQRTPEPAPRQRTPEPT